MQEAACRLDQPVTQFGGERRLRALFVSAGNIDGLIRRVNRRRSEMKRAAGKAFDDIDLLRRDLRLDGTKPGEQGDSWFWSDRPPRSCQAGLFRGGVDRVHGL